MSIEKRIERIEAILDARGLDWDHPRVEDEPSPVDFGDKDHPVVMRQTMVFSLSQSDKNQPSKEPPKKWRILEPGEEVQEGDLVNCKLNPPSYPPNGDGWIDASICVGSEVAASDECVFARPVADEPAKEPEPAWEPKVGDWVRVTRPENWRACQNPEWVPALHQHNGMVMQISRFGERYGAWVANFDSIDWFFHRDWLSPAEPPEPEYREPALPGDAGKVCQFSDDGQSWLSGWVHGWVPDRNWVTLNNSSWKYCRIKKDA